MTTEEEKAVEAAAGSGTTEGAEPTKKTPKTATVDKDFADEMAEELGTGEAGPEKKTTEVTKTTEKVAEPEKKPETEKEIDPEDPEKPEKIKGLTPELQEKFDKRIGKEVGRRKELEETLESERSYSKELREKLEAAETRTRESVTVTAEGIHPAMLAESEGELDKREEYLWKAEEWCDKYREGYEGDGTEANPAYTAEQVRERLFAVRKERERVLPKARELFKRRQDADGRVKLVYPELVDKRSDGYAEMERILAAAPGFRLKADYKMMIGDLLQGRKAREAKLKTGSAAAPTKKAPVVPMESAARMMGEKKTPQGTFEVFVKSGFDEDALADAMDK